MGTGTVEQLVLGTWKELVHFSRRRDFWRLRLRCSYVSDDLLTSRSPSAPYAASLTASKGRLIR